MEENYIGKKLEEVQFIYELNYRIVKANGIAMMVTSDFRDKRHNFTIENGIITNDYLG